MAELKRIRELVERLSSDASSEAIFELTDLYLSAGLSDAALDAVKQWSANNPDSEEGKVLTARVYLENELFDEARSTLQRVDLTSAAGRPGLLVEIDLEIRLGNFHLAEQKIADCRRLCGPCDELMRLESLLDQQVQQGAEVSPDETVVVTPTMADLFFRQGLVEKALVLYRKLLEQDPENVLYHNRVKEICGEQQDREAGENSQIFEDHHQKLTRWLSSIQRRRTHV